MKLEFGKYTEITNLAKRVNPGMYNQYEKVYICPDTNNWWVSCILKGYNKDYEECSGMYLIERNNPDYPDYCKCNEKYLNLKTVENVLNDWDGLNWDAMETTSLEDAIDIIDGGFGIIQEND